MTSVTARAENGRFVLRCEGHAEGEDPAVCTAISTLCCSLELWCAMEKVAYVCIKKPGFFEINFGQRPQCRTAFDLVLYALKELQHDYASYLNVSAKYDSIWEIQKK